MADPEFITITGRFGLVVDDGTDAGTDPDVLRPQPGSAARLVPLQGEYQAKNLTPPETRRAAVRNVWVDPEGYIVNRIITDANGNITGYGDRGVKVENLHSEQISPRVPTANASWRLEFPQAGDDWGDFFYIVPAQYTGGGDEVVARPHQGGPLKLTLDDGTVPATRDLTDALALNVGTGQLIATGARGRGLANQAFLQTAINKVRPVLDDGTQGDEITLPPGAPGGSDAATAQWVKEGVETTAALTGSYLYTSTVLTRTMAGIQAAVDRANAAWVAGFIPGATIYMPGGAPYMATEAKPGVELPNTGVPLLFKGDGMSTTVLKKLSSAGTQTNPTHAIHRSIASSVPAGVLRFEDFFIEGVGGHGSEFNVWDKGIYIRGLTGGASSPAVHITRCGAKKNMGETFWTAAALNVYLNNEVSDCPINAYNPVSGQPADPNSLIVVIGNKADTISNGAGSGSGIETVGASIIIAENNFTNVHTAINARGHHSVIVANNVIRDWFGYIVSSPIGTSTSAINVARGNQAWNGAGLFLVEDNNISNYPRGIIAVVNAASDSIGQALIEGNLMNGIDQEAVWVQMFQANIKHLHVLSNSIVNPCRGANNTYSVFRIARGNSASAGSIVRPVIKDNVVAIDTATKAKHAVLFETLAAVSITNPLVKDNDFRDVFATSMIEVVGTTVTGLAREGNMPGGAVPSCVDSGDHYLWTHGGVQRIKSSVPTSLTDGSIVGPSVGAAIHAPQTGGDKTLTQSDNTNWQDVPGVTLSLDVGTYSIAGFLAATGSTTADVNLRFLPDGGLAYSGYYSLGGLIDTATAVTNNQRTVAYLWNASNAVLGLVTGQVIPVVVRGTLVVTTAGTIRLQARQGTAEASDVILRNGLVSATKVA